MKRGMPLLTVRLDDVPLPWLFGGAAPIDLFQGYDQALGLILNALTPPIDPLITFAVGEIEKSSPAVQVVTAVDARLVAHFQRFPNELRQMNRRSFEELVAELFRGFGYSVELTAKTRDGGRDVVAIGGREVRSKLLIECKRPDPGGVVGIRPVRELYGVKVDEGATKAVLATTAHFSRDALLFFERHRWEMESRDFDGLLEWISWYTALRMGT